jgi:hypothetical protein
LDGAAVGRLFGERAAEAASGELLVDSGAESVLSGVWSLDEIGGDSGESLSGGGANSVLSEVSSRDEIEVSVGILSVGSGPFPVGEVMERDELAVARVVEAVGVEIGGFDEELFAEAVDGVEKDA